MCFIIGGIFVNYKTISLIVVRLSISKHTISLLSFLTYIKNNIIHCAIPNIPGSVANTASTALSNATYNYILYLANNGVENLITKNIPFSKGINTLNGHVTHDALAKSLDLQYVDGKEAL